MRLTAALLLVLIVLPVGCSTLRSDWQRVSETDTTDAYQAFLSKHGRGELADHARVRIGRLTIEDDWREARLQDTARAYEVFIRSHPDNEFTDEAMRRFEECLLNEDWSVARALDSEAGYGGFLEKHPHSTYSELAESEVVRIGALRELQDWKQARGLNSVAGYEEFLIQHPNGLHSVDATATLSELRRELADWQLVEQADAEEAYEEFLQLHPDGNFAKHAEARIIDLEVAEIVAGSHAELPPPTRVGSNLENGHSRIRILNDTVYQLTVRYSGPGSFKLTLPPNEWRNVQVISGQYAVAASVSATGILPFAGVCDLQGEYDVQYYVETVSP